MLCVPAGRLLVVHAALRVLPEPASATALQPAIDEPPSVKLTLPVGAVPVTVAVNVTLAPTGAGLSELVTMVVVGAAEPGVTYTHTELLVDAVFAASPP